MTRSTRGAEETTPHWSASRRTEQEEAEVSQWAEDESAEEEYGALSEEESPNKRLALVTWEDVTAYARVEIPNDFEQFRLIKKTLGLLWAETDDYVVLVQDYDVSNRGKGFHHNDFHIIPRGIIKEIRYLGEEPV